MSTFTPPAVADVGPVFGSPGLGVNRDRERGGRAGHLLMRHYAPSSRYQWVLRTAGVYATVDYPTSDQLAAASEAYCGPTVVSSAVAAALTSAGYGSHLS